MPDPTTPSPIPRLLTALAGALWLLGIVQVFAHSAALSTALTVCLAAFVLLALPRTGRHAQVLCLLLAAAAAALAASYGTWDAVPRGIARATIFPGFLATIVLLRATADQRPEIAAARRAFAALDRRDRGGGIAVGAHLLGAVVQVGVFAILAPIVGRDASVGERRRVFLIAMRGMALVPLWSPFVVAMAVASQYLPHVPLWQVMGLGLAAAAVGLLVSIALFDGAGGAAAMGRSLATLAPVAPPVAVAALIVVGLTALTGLTTLQALLLGLPAPCLLAVGLSRTGSVAAVVRQTAGGLGRIGTETSILACAMTMGVVFEACLPATGLLEAIRALALPPAAIVFLVVMAMNVFGLMGVHAMVTGTVLLVIFTGIDTGVADVILFQAMLTGWGLCTAISLGSLSVATGAAMFDLPPTRLISPGNIGYVFLTSALIAAALAGINPLLR